jgi:hypothetical protein
MNRLTDIKAQGYIKSLRNPEKKRFAALYWRWISEGSRGAGPCRQELSYMTAQAVRLNLDTFLREETSSTTAVPGADELKLANQWWTMQSEQERRRMLEGVSGCLSYGLVVSWHLLPIQGQERVLEAYRASVILSSDTAVPGDKSPAVCRLCGGDPVLCNCQIEGLSAKARAQIAHDNWRKGGSE